MLPTMASAEAFAKVSKDALLECSTCCPLEILTSESPDHAVEVIVRRDAAFSDESC